MFCRKARVARMTELAELLEDAFTLRHNKATTFHWLDPRRSRNTLLYLCEDMVTSGHPSSLSSCHYFYLVDWSC